VQEEHGVEMGVRRSSISQGEDGAGWKEAACEERAREARVCPVHHLKIFRRAARIKSKIP
jgi:hypothetical protein